MSTYSSNLRLELIGTGEQQGTWGITTNTNLGTLLEQAITGYTAISVTDGADTTLTVANGASDQSRNMTLNLSGSLSAARTVICPATPKIYVVKNATTGGYAVTLKVTGQTGVSIPNGSTVVVYVDGTDVRLVSQFPVPVSQGGTGVASSTGTGSVVLSTSPTLSGTPLIGSNKIDAFASGTRLLFQQTSAPTGWTKDTSQNDKALRVVSGSASTGGTTAFSSVFTSRTPSGSISSTTSTGSIGSTTSTGTIGGTAISTAQMPYHQHLIANGVNGTGGLNSGNYVNYQANYGNNNDYTLAGNVSGPDRGLTSGQGGGQAHDHPLYMNAHSHSLSMNSHSHSFSGTAMDFAVQYVDVIIAQKD